LGGKSGEYEKKQDNQTTVEASKKQYFLQHNNISFF
jgi:hypothetical protein